MTRLCQRRRTQPVDVQPTDPSSKRKPGKQPGAPGFGRTQGLHAHEEQAHYPLGCAGCGQPLTGAAAGCLYRLSGR
ncbi:MAG: hypothetical protein IPL99_29290 [Candidatus Competibacteraceae bacterium]|nr:hypothetical protein [Candidatus Competibacteraceae bacterium]